MKLLQVSKMTSEKPAICCRQQQAWWRIFSPVMSSSCSNVQVWASTSVIVACSVGLLLFCFVFVDVRQFVSKTTTPIFLQLGFRPDPSLALQSSESENSVAAVQELADIATTSDDAATRDSGSGEKKIAEEVQVLLGAGSWPPQDQSSSRKKNSILSQLADCNIAEGEWVYDDSYPLYRSKNCPFADPGFRCEENGRPDAEYMQYRWQPHGCSLPRFNATDVLERLRGQRMVYVGDSIGRNHWESMLCMLAEGVQDKSQIYEVNGETISKHTGFLSFKFEDYDNLTVEYYREPFLIPQTRPPPNAPPNVTYALIVDQPCWSSPKWEDADILVFNAGHWWTDQKIRNQGFYFQEGNEINMDMDIETAFAKSLRTLVKWMDANVSPKTQIFFRSFASVHFRGGAWNTGGHCHEEIHPMSEEEARVEWAKPWSNKVMMNEVLQHNNNTKSRKRIAATMTYIDITTSTNYRSDAHSGLYYRDNSISKTPLNKQDCSHFCLPGVPDTWNELLVASLLSQGKGAWGQPVRF